MAIAFVVIVSKALFPSGEPQNKRQQLEVELRRKYPDKVDLRAISAKRVTEQQEPKFTEGLDAQSFEGFKDVAPEYRRSLAEKSSRIDLIPLGHFTSHEQDMSKRLKDFLKVFYECSVDLCPPIAVDIAKLPTENGRILANDLFGIVPDQGATVTLAIIAHDITWRNKKRPFNFVFGKAEVKRYMAVMSLMKLLKDDVSETEKRRRVFVVGARHVAEAIGILPYPRYECAMNATTSIDMLNKAPLFFCPECEQKVWLAAASDPLARYQSLIDFAEHEGLEREKSYWNVWLARILGEP